MSSLERRNGADYQRDTGNTGYYDRLSLQLLKGEGVITPLSGYEDVLKLIRPAVGTRAIPLSLLGDPKSYQFVAVGIDNTDQHTPNALIAGLPLGVPPTLENLPQAPVSIETLHTTKYRLTVTKKLHDTGEMPHLTQVIYDQNGMLVMAGLGTNRASQPAELVRLYLPNSSEPTPVSGWRPLYDWQYLYQQGLVTEEMRGEIPVDYLTEYEFDHKEDVSGGVTVIFQTRQYPLMLELMNRDGWVSIAQRPIDEPGTRSLYIPGLLIPNQNASSGGEVF